MNSDNYVHEGFEHLDENILADKTMYALTRREIAYLNLKSKGLLVGLKKRKELAEIMRFP